MKKILIATTALVATSSVAAAEVVISGLGRFGLDYQEDRDFADGSDGETQLDSRLRFNIDANAETDGGIQFGARLRIQSDNDESDGSSNSAAFNGPRFHVESGGFRVEVGNIAGTTDASSTINTYGFEPGLTFNHGQYSNWGAVFPAYTTGDEGVNGVSAQYEAGDFKIMASYTEDWDENQATPAVDDFAESAEIGVAYTFSGWTIGAVYGNTESSNSTPGDDQDFYALSLAGSIGPADAVFFIGDTDSDDGALDGDAVFGASVAFPVGASTTIEAAVSTGGDTENGTAGDDKDTSFSIGFDHSLGGGVTLQGMAGQNIDGDTQADFGVLFTF